MGKYDEFDLNIKYEDATNSGARLKTLKDCLELSFKYCEDASKLIDCTSKVIDCSGGVWSKCNACGSSAMNAARC